MAIWKLEQIDWLKFDITKVDVRMVPLVKMASLVEYNSGDYVDYLLNVFKGDSEIEAEIRAWGDDERLHGTALRLYAEKVDPNFDFEKSFKKFTSTFKIPSGESGSIRGSQAQELVSRCLIETGTTTYYSALADAAEEPVLKQICKFIAADEVHHYKIFFKALGPYGKKENLSRFAKVKTALSRAAEVDDEELAVAYGCANYPDREISVTDFQVYNHELMKWAYQMYKPVHFTKAARLILNATGLPNSQWLAKGVSKTLYGLMKRRERKMLKQDHRAS
jgi:rubrerythrin